MSTIVIHSSITVMYLSRIVIPIQRSHCVLAARLHAIILSALVPRLVCTQIPLLLIHILYILNKYIYPSIYLYIYVCNDKSAHPYIYVCISTHLPIYTPIDLSVQRCMHLSIRTFLSTSTSQKTSAVSAGAVKEMAVCLYLGCTITVVNG